MKKVYEIEIDCAVCASKVESAVAAIEGVDSAAVDFARGRMTVEAAEIDKALTKQIIRTAKKIEPDCEISEV